MADEVKLVTFAGETVTPTYDAIMQELYTNGGGIITGATVTIKDANTLHIADGYAAICGREVKIFASDIPVALSSSGTLNGRLYLHMDLSQPTNPLTLLTEVAASLTPVQQDANVNTTNGIYEINLATFSVGTSTISNLVSVAPTIKNINARTLQTVNDCDLSTDLQDIAGAAALSELNSKLPIVKKRVLSAVACDVQWSAGLYLSSTYTISYSDLGLTNNPRINAYANPASDGNGCWVLITNITNTTLSFQLLRGTSKTIATTIYAEITPQD